MAVAHGCQSGRSVAMDAQVPPPQHETSMIETLTTTYRTQTLPEPVIGVLGGMGPEATIELLARVVRATPAHDDADHLRILVDNNPKVPSRIAHLIEKTGIDPGPTLGAMAANLVTAGADVLAIPCNTAHYYLPAIVAAVSVPVIDMVSASLDRIRARHGDGGALGLLASPAVRSTRLFATGAAKRGLRIVYPQGGDPAAILAMIRAVKAQSVTESIRNAYHDVIARLEPDVHVLVLACTELSVAGLPAAYAGRTLDTLDVLVDEILRAAGRR